MKKFYSSIGRQRESTKPSAPIISIGTGPAREKIKLDAQRVGPGSYVSISTLDASHPTLASPGYTAFSKASRPKNGDDKSEVGPADYGTNIARVVISTVKSAPSISFGTSKRPNYGTENNPTLNAKMSYPSNGLGSKQPLSHQRNGMSASISARTKLSGDRVTPGDPEVPGPCYMLPTTLGKQNVSIRRSASSVQFGSSARMQMAADLKDAPGPVSITRFLFRLFLVFNDMGSVPVECCEPCTTV